MDWFHRNVFFFSPPAATGLDPDQETETEAEGAAATTTGVVPETESVRDDSELQTRTSAPPFVPVSITVFFKFLHKQICCRINREVVSMKLWQCCFKLISENNFQLNKINVFLTKRILDCCL